MLRYRKKREKNHFVVVVDYRLPSSRPPLGNGQLPIATEMSPSRLTSVSLLRWTDRSVSAAITQTVGRGDLLWIRLSSIFKKSSAQPKEKRTPN
jgi:hypothetical protein